MESAYPTSAYSPTNGNHINGYANGGSEAAHSDLGDDDSEDDDSNPLEDLEALGESEEAAERMREDEEGLRNAKELSRQGFEQSVRSSQAVNSSNLEANVEPPAEQSTTPAFINASEGEEMHHVYEDTPVTADDADTMIVPPRVVNGTESVEEAVPLSMPPVNGGFRAVNEQAAVSSLPTAQDA